MSTQQGNRQSDLEDVLIPRSLVSTHPFSPLFRECLKQMLAKSYEARCTNQAPPGCHPTRPLSVPCRAEKSASSGAKPGKSSSSRRFAQLKRSIVVERNCGWTGLGLKAVWSAAEKFGDVLGRQKGSQSSQRQLEAPAEARQVSRKAYRF